MALLQKKDVVLVGYGAASGPISVELAKAGYSVVALERGEHRTTDEFAETAFDTLRWETRREMVPRLPELPLTFRSDLSAVAEPTSYLMANTVGGASVHWSGQSWRFYEDDFRVRSTLEDLYGQERLEYLRQDGANIQDWPISYQDVESYYEKVEYNLGVGGWPGNIQGDIRPVNPEEGNPFEAPRERDYPFRPLRDNATDITFRQGALDQGLDPFHVPTAIVTESGWTSDYGIERAACTYCTFCTWYGCWNGSKSSTLVAMLPAAMETGNFELRPNSQVMRINYEGDRATSVEYLDLLTGEVHTQPGDIFFLGSYSFQNVRLLLYSGIDGGGQVGKYFINRSGPSVSAIFDDRYLNGYNGPAVQRQGVDNYNGENNAEEKLSLPEGEFFVRGAFIGSPSQRFPLNSYDSIPPDLPRWGADFKEYYTENLNRYISLQLLQEPIPYETSYIDLDPNYTDQWGVPAARVQRQVKTNEINMSRYIARKGEEILNAAGASLVWSNEEPAPSATMTHDCGGLRMGEDASMSATNRYGQLWQIPNIFVGGGALFPTMSGHNPTETIYMLSYWTADAIKDGKVNMFDSRDIR